MKQQINESEKNRIRNLHREHFILKESPVKLPEVPSDTTGTNVGQNLRISSKELGVSNTYKLKVSFGFLSKKPKIESFDLDPNKLVMKIKLPYGSGNLVEKALKKAPLSRFGAKYKMEEGGFTESDRLIITIDATTKHGEPIVRRALAGVSPISVMDDGADVELIKV